MPYYALIGSQMHPLYVHPSIHHIFKHPLLKHLANSTQIHMETPCVGEGKFTQIFLVTVLSGLTLFQHLLCCEWFSSVLFHSRSGMAVVFMLK